MSKHLIDKNRYRINELIICNMLLFILLAWVMYTITQINKNLAVMKYEIDAVYSKQFKIQINNNTSNSNSNSSHNNNLASHSDKKGLFNK